MFIRVHSWPYRLIFSALLSVPLIYAIRATASLAQADRLAQSDTVDSLTAASRIEPANADYHARIASLDPSRDDQLQAALQLNPTNPSWWIMHSIRQEEDGDLAGAEASLLQANSVCLYYTPRWSLASFYYRQQRRPEFTKWARAALSVGYGDPDSLFRMAQKLGLTADAILRDIVPPDPNKVAAFLSLERSDGNIDHLYQPAAKLIALGSKPDRDAILADAETLFLRGQPAQALALWNHTVQAGWTPFSPLDPNSGKSLARGNFRGERIQQGFDWKYPATAGVSLSTAEPDGALRLEFNGKEPPNCELAGIYTPLLPNRTYCLTIRQHSQSIVAGSGLQWSVQTLPTAQRIASLPLSEQSVTFRTPSSPAPMRLVLSYSRSPGTTRIEGILWVDSVLLALLP